MVHICNNMYKIVKLVLHWSGQLYVTLGVLPTVCLVMLLAGDPCFVQVMPAVCLVMLLLSGDHALCGSRQ